MLKGNQKNQADANGLEIAERIIVIQGDDDIDEDLTYEQLMAEGTVIVIKDDDVRKEYAKHISKKIPSSKREKGSEKSSEPNYDTLMAEECIIVIKDDNDKREYCNFLKKRKGRSDRSSNINYD